MEQATLAALLNAWPEALVRLGDFSEIEPVARRLNCEPDRLPLAVLRDKAGRARVGTAGYRGGTVELLLRTVGYVCRE